MPLGNSKVELKLEWTKHCVLFVLCNGNRNYNSDIIIFNTKETKNLFSCHQFISKTQSKTFKTSKQRVWKVCVWDEYQTKNENKCTKNEYRHFFESNFAGVNRFFDLIYSNKYNNTKRCKAQR